jgi:glycerophosphoryl diester phosphodiesterase
MKFFIFFLIFCFSKCTSSHEKTPLVIAHRGASAYLPEHTLESKSMAYVMGSDYLEQDLVLTKDNIPVVLHDIYLDEVTDVATLFGSTRARNDTRYYAIDFTLAEIKTLSVTERFVSADTYDKPKYPKRFPLWTSKFQISTFKEEIELVQGLQKSLKQSSKPQNHVVGIYPEIKNPYFHFKEGRENFSEIVLKILADFNYTKSSDAVFLQCFDPFELIRIRKVLKSNLTMVQLIDTQSDERINYTYWASEIGLKNISSFAQGIGPYKDLLIELDSSSEKYVKPSELTINAKKMGLAIHAYTFRVDGLPLYVTDHDEMLRIFVEEVKVDGLFTDFPDVAVDFLRRMKNDGNRSSGRNFLNFLLIIICASLSMFYSF